jgi:hypothetical protein
MSEQVAANAVLLRTSMEIELDASEPLSVQDVLREIPQLITLTPYWLEQPVSTEGLAGGYCAGTWRSVALRQTRWPSR